MGSLPYLENIGIWHKQEKLILFNFHVWANDLKLVLNCLPQVATEQGAHAARLQKQLFYSFVRCGLNITQRVVM